MVDTGSWVLVSRRLPPYSRPDSKAIESWCGLSADLDMLPKTGCTGSTAYCIDTGDRYMFEETTDTWYPVLSSGGSGSAPEGVAPYTGPYSVTPKASVTQILPTSSKYMKNNVTVAKIPYSETSNASDGTTVSIAAS